MFLWLLILPTHATISAMPRKSLTFQNSKTLDERLDLIHFDSQRAQAAAKFDSHCIELATRLISDGYERHQVAKKLSQTHAAHLRANREPYSASKKPPVAWFTSIISAAEARLLASLQKGKARHQAESLHFYQRLARGGEKEETRLRARERMDKLLGLEEETNVNVEITVDEMARHLRAAISQAEDSIPSYIDTTGESEVIE